MCQALFYVLGVEKSTNSFAIKKLLFWNRRGTWPITYIYISHVVISTMKEHQ